MIVTQIKRERGSTVKVFTDLAPPFLVDRSLAATIGLAVGTTLDEHQIRDILERSDYERAKSRALWHLDRCDHTEKALYDKLCRAGFSKESSAKVLARLCELGLIDDRRYAERYAEKCLASGVSKRETYAKMLSKGVPKELICQTLEDMVVDENKQIHLVIQKKYARRLECGEDPSKVYAALVRKGFSYSAVRNALKAYLDETGFCEE